VIVQRAIEAAGIPTILIAALPPIARQGGTPRAVAPCVPMGANAGEPHNTAMQNAIVEAALQQLVAITMPGTIVSLPYTYGAHL
jgi:D-proline reductase (dithiol) PrdB